MAVAAEQIEKQQSLSVQPEASDYTAAPVPLEERRGSATMGLLWITMVTGFPSVLIGFEWFKIGVSLPQLIGCVIVSAAILLLYCLPSCMLGAQSGLTYALLSRKVFGRWGSWVVSLNLMWLSIAWYGLTAVFLASGLEGLYHWHFNPMWFSVALAVVMAFNNFFGFSGVANFARYLAGPVLVLWVAFTFIKAGIACPATVWTEPAKIGLPGALTLVSSFVIGYTVWGNEPDYWRFGKPNKRSVLAPIMVALLIGELIFPITGWMLARMTGITDYASATALMNSYAFGGVSFIAAAVLVVTYFAVNDSSLYGAINALQNIHPFPRQQTVGFVAIAGALTAALLSGVPNNFEEVAALSCIFLPCATVVVVAEHWLVSKLHEKPGELSRIPSFEELPAVRWSAIAAFACGCTFGVITAGILPGLAGLRMGVPALQAWVMTLVTYLLFRRIENWRKETNGAKRS